ncbi:sulfite oxidase heme-binding subunit YedZ [Jannaschia aquimarina]|uniref:sulfite oxidase heme-binding subunit YedZ n=1 Tax=Jannaschia aquimarina TaxID=935700 RepID=UPI001FD30A3C|nr:protein-methionine-sulfoxide reductase heme-binding subunit MsrQ [Jannaschia aquimarina]
MVRQVPAWPLYVLGALPGIWLVWAGINGGLGVDPVKAMEHRAGLWGLQFLLASLCITPLLRLGRVNLMKFRKPLGLIGFGYVTFHFLIWMALDLSLRWGEIGADLIKRPYIVVGFLGFLALTPLAATSWGGAKRWLGTQAWCRLHRLVYVAVILGAVHFVMQAKVWTMEIIAYLAVTGGLVGLRLIWLRSW